MILGNAKFRVAVSLHSAVAGKVVGLMDRHAVFAADVATGRVLWKKTAALAAGPGSFQRLIRGAGRVFAVHSAGARYSVVCYRLNDGKRLWETLVSDGAALHTSRDPVPFARVSLAVTTQPVTTGEEEERQAIPPPFAARPFVTVNPARIEPESSPLWKVTAVPAAPPGEKEEPAAAPGERRKRTMDDLAFLKTKPLTPADYFRRSQILWQLGKLEEAMEEYKKAVRADPRYLARQDNGWNGALADCEFFVGDSPEQFDEPAAKATFRRTKKAQEAKCKPTRGRYVLLRVLSEVNGNPWASVAELGVVGE